MFTRNRKLPFTTVLRLLLSKSVRSLQLVLNEWTEDLEYDISASALSQARRKLKHTAFIELHQRAIVGVMYRGGDYETYRGKRLLGLDCTTLRLPNSKELRERFGTIAFMNGKRRQKSNQVEAQASILYDLLNRIPITGYLSKGRTNEAKTALDHLGELGAGDLVIADRGYVNYRLFSSIVKQKADFVIRCKRGAFEKYHNLFAQTAANEVVADVLCPAQHKLQTDLFPSIKVRFVRVLLDTGEVEVLATSLLDTDSFPHESFKELYHKRWGIETYIQTLKSRCAIDNFSGKSVEAVLQDFYSTLFVSGLETILTEEANEELAAKDTLHPQQVNKAISFHTIKNKVVKLILDPPRDLDAQIKKLFLQNPTSVRPHRLKPPRKSSPTNQNRYSLYFQKFVRKHVY